MTSTTTHLSDAKAALDALSGVTVRLRKQKYPASTKKLIILDRIVSTPIGDYEATGKHIVVQVNCYAPTPEEAEAMADQAQEALEGAGFTFESDRPAQTDDTDPLHGVTADYTR